VAFTFETLRRKIRRSSYPLLAGFAMAVLTISLWQFAERQERVSANATVQTLTEGLIQNTEFKFASHAEAVSRMAQRWVKSGGTSQEEWAFDARNYKRDIPGFNNFTWIDDTLTVQWLLRDGELIEPRQSNTPVQRTAESKAYLEYLRDEKKQPGTFYYVSRLGERMLLLYVPMFDGEKFLGFLGGAIEVPRYLKGIFGAYEGDLEVVVTHEGDPIFQSLGCQAGQKLVSTRKFSIGDSDFSIEAYATPKVINATSSSLPFVVLCVGFTWTLIVAWLIHQSSVIKQKSGVVERQALALDQTSDAMFIHNQEQGILDCNAAAINLFGYSKSELIGMHTRDLAADPGSLRPLYADRDEKLALHGRWSVTIKTRTKPGDIRMMSIAESELKDARGRTVGFVSMARDVTDEEDRKAELAESEFKFRGLFESSRDGIAIRPVTPQGVKGVSNVNQAYLDLTGYTQEELNSLPEQVLVPLAEDRAKLLVALAQLEEQGYADTISLQYKRKDGSYRHAETTLWRAIKDSTGEHTQTIALVRDVTEQEANREKLVESENKFRRLFESSRDAICIRSARGSNAGRVIDANQAYLDLVGYDLDEVPVYSADNMVMTRDSYTVIEPYLKRLGQQGYTDPFNVNFLRKNGTTVPANVQLWRTYDDDDEHAQTITIARDMTEAVQAEEGMKEAQQIAQLGSWDFDLIRKTGSWSHEMYRIFEVEVPGRPLDYHGLMEILHPDDRDKFAQDRKRADRENIPVNDIYRIVMSDGRTKYLRFNFRTILGADGAVIKRLGTAQDITAIRELEDALRHTQKLQTVGQLTAGIAHDFNNILGVISSNAQYLEMIVTDSPDVNVTVDRVVRAVKRGAKLTDQMLSFSRKQALAPTQIDTASFLEELTDTVSRALGEEITMDVDVPDAPWSVMADETQLTNALLNLSLNGRDAMEGAGSLKIRVQNIDVHEGEDASARNIEAGSYVAISVQDSGTGMTQEVQDQAFEPFFTTKEIGAGSGLGLSMVYGFADQSGGTVTLDSEVGVGTTITLYLPATDQQGELTLAKPQKESVAPPAVRTILLVEDQPDLRVINEQVLQKLGHRVITAEDAASAMLAVSKVDHIDAAFLDIILPGGVKGIELAARLRDTRPSLKILFTTGYAARDVLDKIDHVEHDGLFRKPIQIQDVSARLGEIFGADKSNVTDVGKYTAA